MKMKGPILPNSELTCSDSPWVLLVNPLLFVIHREILYSSTHASNYKATSKATVERDARSAQWGTLCLALCLLKDL